MHMYEKADFLFRLSLVFMGCLLTLCFNIAWFGFNFSWFGKQRRLWKFNVFEFGNIFPQNGHGSINEALLSWPIWAICEACWCFSARWNCIFNLDWNWAQHMGHLLTTCIGTSSEPVDTVDIQCLSEAWTTQVVLSHDSRLQPFEPAKIYWLK